MRRLLPWGLLGRGIAVRAQAESDQGERVNLAAGFQILLRLELLQGIRGGLIPGPRGVLGLQKPLGCQGTLDLAVTVRRGDSCRLRQVTPRLAVVFLPREEALLVAVPGLREDAVPGLDGGAFFLAAFFLASAFFWGATAPSALQASTIIAAMAAQVRIFLMDSIASVSIPLHEKGAGGPRGYSPAPDRPGGLSHLHHTLPRVGRQRAGRVAGRPIVIGSFAQHAELHGIARFPRAAELGDVLGRVHRLPVDRQDHVAGQQADVIGGGTCLLYTS